MSIEPVGDGLDVFFDDMMGVLESIYWSTRKEWREIFIAAHHNSGVFPLLAHTYEALYEKPPREDAKSISFMFPVASLITILSAAADTVGREDPAYVELYELAQKYCGDPIQPGEVRTLLAHGGQVGAKTIPAPPFGSGMSMN